MEGRGLERDKDKSDRTTACGGGEKEKKVIQKDERGLEMLDELDYSRGSSIESSQSSFGNQLYPGYVFQLGGESECSLVVFFLVSREHPTTDFQLQVQRRPKRQITTLKARRCRRNLGRKIKWTPHWISYGDSITEEYFCSEIQQNPVFGEVGVHNPKSTEVQSRWSLGQMLFRDEVAAMFGCRRSSRCRGSGVVSR
ncbi:hypothetical protein U1Q18_046091 [Sarracenia purpurea var. burkii]